MAERLEDVLRALGEQLAGEGVTERERSWRRLLATDREAALLVEQLEVRRSEILRMDPVPAEWFPCWDEEARCSLWVEAGDLEAMDGWSELHRRWREFDPVACPPDPVDGFSNEELDDVSYELFLTRLPDPGGVRRGPTFVEYLADLRQGDDGPLSSASSPA